MRGLPIVLLCLFGSVLPGCFTSRDPLFCTVSADCQDVEGRPFCDVDGSYADEIARTCIASPFGECTTSAMCVDGLGPVCDPVAMSCVPCVANGECADKNSREPVCLPSGACAECAVDTDCGPSRPICREDEEREFVCGTCERGVDTCPNPGDICTSTGACSECEFSTDCSTASEPVCDPTQGGCRGCIENSECDSQVCNKDTGECVSEDDIIYVDGTTGNDTDNCGTGETPPCETITEAIGNIQGTRTWIKVAATEYTETIEAPAELKLIGEDGVIIDPPANNPAISVGTGEDLFVDSVLLTGASGDNIGDGITCLSGAATPANIKLLQVTIDDNAELGINATNCNITIERSQISLNAGGGVDLDGGTFVLRNNLIIVNGNDAPGGSLFGGVRIQADSETSPQIVEFNTIANNESVEASSPTAGLLCTSVMPIPVANNVIAKNRGPDEQFSGNCSHSYSLIEGSHRIHGSWG